MKTVADHLRQTLLHLHSTLKKAESQWSTLVDQVHPKQKASAINLLHYLALRCEDLRDVQDDLHNAGLSSLASSESHVRCQIEAVLRRLDKPVTEQGAPAVDYYEARRILQKRASQLFGPKSNPYIPQLMVTFDSGLAEDYKRVKTLVKAGMNVARINCAHDDPDSWKRMVNNIQKAMRATGHSCRIYMDLAGPKIRTKILGKGRKKGHMNVVEHERFWLTESNVKPKKGRKNHWLHSSRDSSRPPARRPGIV